MFLTIKFLNLNTKTLKLIGVLDKNKFVFMIFQYMIFNRLNKRKELHMSSKKKSATKKVAPAEAEPIEPEPAEELPVRQIEEVQDAAPEPVEQSAESKSVVETAPIVEPVPQEAEPEKSAGVVPPPVVEPAPVKPKPLTMTSLHADLEALRQIVEQQAILIKQLMETPARQRKPPTSNGKVSIKDTLTGKIYPSKNNVYQTLLKAGELDDLVKQGVFGADPIHNSFGCYNLFRAYPGRFVEVKPSDAT